MKFQIALLAIITLAELSSAQLLPPKKTENIPKIDSALVFRINYGDESTPIDNPQKENQAIIEQHNGKSNQGSFDTKNSLIWAGICATEAALSIIFDSNNSLQCVPAPNIKF